MFFHQEPDAKKLSRLQLSLAMCEANERHMKLVNHYYHEHGTVEGCPGVSPEAAEMIDEGIKNGGFPDGQPFPAHTVLHEYYEIQRLKREIEALSPEDL